MPKSLHFLSLREFSAARVYKYKNKILEALRPLMFQLFDERAIAYEALKLHKEFVGLENSDVAINKAAAKVLVHFGMRLSSELSYQVMVRDLLLIHNLPALTYRRIAALVKADLQELQLLIDRYEVMSYIKDYLKDDEKPRNHEEKILHDFYRRCIQERSIIWNYYLNGLENRAMAVTESMSGMLGYALKWRQEYSDRPYLFWIPYHKHVYDTNKIEDFWHRVKLFPINFEEKAERIFKKNKQQFYRLFFKLHPKKTIFAAMDYFLGYLPLNAARKPIFEEMQNAFLKRRWISFYALALAQIEGLFSEMNQMISGIGGVKNALPDKVASVRDYHQMSDYYFDYYQYQVPRLRNKFMHAGYDEDYQLKSFDLLLDIAYLLSVISELKSPYVKLNRIVKVHDPHAFVTFDDYVEYISLCAELKPEQKTEMADMLEKFEIEQLKDYHHMDFTIGGILPQVSTELDSFLAELLAATTLNLKTFPKEKIKKMFKEETFKEKVQRHFDVYHLKVETIEGYLTFQQGYEKYLPSLDDALKKELKKTFKTYAAELKNFRDCLRLLKS